MAVLEKIRVKFGLAISIIIALALLSFIIDPSTLTSAVQSMSKKYDVGNINGNAISYTDFQGDVEQFTRINEMLTGSSVQGEEAQKQIRNTAWQSLIDKYLFIKNAKAAGLAVGEDEMVALTTGDMVSPLLSQNYSFLDANGNFDPDALVEFVKGIESDETGSLKTYWNYLQNTIYTQQFYTKYGSLFTNSNVQNPLMKRNAIAENNTSTNVDFVMVPFSFATDSTIVISDNDIKNYYNNHKDFFKQNASRDIEYVVFEVVPSEKDIQAVSEKMTDLMEEFSTTEAMKSFLLKNSDRALSEYWYRAGELNTVNAELNDFVFSTEKDAASVSPVIKSQDTFLAGRVMASAMVPDSAYVKHILLQGDNAEHLADSLVNVVAKGENFANAAAVYSADQGSAYDGELGTIGWMTQSYMIPGFESVITAEVNKPYVIKTQYGTHVVLVTKKSTPVLKKQVAILEKTAIAGKETFNEYYAKANKFATIANGSYNNYRAAVDTMGVYSHPMDGVLESTANYGAITNAKEVTRWIFDNKKGKVSNIITVNNNFFFIATVKGIHKEGYATVAEAAPSIKSLLYSEEYGKKLAAQTAEKIAGLTSLEAIAEKLGTSVSTQSAMTFSALSNQGLDPAFIGAASAAPQGKICGPVAGSIGVYVFQVNGRDTGSYYTEDDAAAYEAQKAQYNSQLILPVMMQDADVKDNRARFY